MKRATILFFALLLVPAAQADAKFSSARVCGPSGCREVGLTAGHTVLTMGEAAFSTRSRLTSKTPEASPWYRVRLCPGRCASRHALTLKVLPTAGYEYVTRKAHAARRGWAKLDEHAADVYRSVTTGLEPYPASSLLALGATEPTSVPGEDPGSRGASSQGGIPAWAWIAISATAAALALLFLRRLQRLRRSPSVH
jgi:hypothetical protein